MYAAFVSAMEIGGWDLVTVCVCMLRSCYAWSYMSCVFCCNGVAWMESVEEGGGKGVGWD